ncbi:MAG TPA: ATP-binding protein [Gallionellaceae bacterium]|nr:ATP-binding protein [Gallionellaceae bacterium]
MHPQDHGVQDVRALAIPLKAITPGTSLEGVAELFLDPEYAEVLSLPVVDDGEPVGVISRYAFMDIYLKPYGRELHGKRPIRNFMSGDPLLVGHDWPLEEAALHVAQNMRFPLMEDFIITEQGRYIGIGFVVDLLKAMEGQMRDRSEELKDAYSRLQSSQLALVQSEKMASLGQMVAGIAHEINTPLGYVRNNVAVGQELFAQVKTLNERYEALVDSLLNEHATEDEVAGHIARVNELRSAANANEMLDAMHGLMEDSIYGIGQISDLVLNLKDFSRMDAAALEAMSVNRCIESALRIGRNVLKDKVEVVAELSDVPEIECAPSQLNQVFLNLFTNAAQAMDGNGTLHIRTWHEDGNINVSVQDSGKGISPENLARIFDPFFTTKPVGQGTGLGLAITHQIIQRHGGEIKAESTVGAGTRFHIRLPAAGSEARGNSPVSVAQALLSAA